MPYKKSRDLLVTQGFNEDESELRKNMCIPYLSMTSQRSFDTVSDARHLKTIVIFTFVCWWLGQADVWQGVHVEIIK